MRFSAEKLLVEFNLGLFLLLPSYVSTSPFIAVRQAIYFLVLLDSGIVVVCCLQRGFSQSHHSLSLHPLRVFDIGSLF